VGERRLSHLLSDFLLVAEETQLPLALDNNMDTDSSDENGSSLWREVRRGN
jgi:hypothetical protein